MSEANSNLRSGLKNDVVTIMYNNMNLAKGKHPLEYRMFSEIYTTHTKIFKKRQCSEIMICKGHFVIFEINNVTGGIPDTEYPGTLTMYVYGTKWIQRSAHSPYFDPEDSRKYYSKDCNFLSKIIGFKKIDKGQTIIIEEFK